MKKLIAALTLNLIVSTSLACDIDYTEVICRAQGLEIKLTEEGGYVSAQMGAAIVSNLNAEETDLDPAKNISLAYVYDNSEIIGFNFSAQSVVDATNLTLVSTQNITAVDAVIEDGTFMKFNYETEQDEPTPYMVTQSTKTFDATLNGTFRGQNLDRVNVTCTEVIVEDSRDHESH